MQSFGKTDIGKTRRINQDYIFFSDSPIGNLPNLYIVADGMGGHKAGEFASKFAVERAVDIVSKHELNSPIAILQDAYKVINKELIEEAKTNEEHMGMGTTLVIATVVDSQLFVANVGDSRLYVMRNFIKQITLDHSLVEELIRSGELKRDQIRNHPEKNIITRALGAEKKVVPDFFEVTLSKGDKILLCSDGLTNMVDDNEILQLCMSNHQIEDKVNSLVDRANYYGGKDNIAVIVAQNQ
ncbi:MAG: Stp1/IreP family PP2C-type Ser/Thr phosphatase [Lachnospiraceae bacterium]|nr:Stp1/IreP family PP2C-type Ser/Thr phosphatase [Lachnospiraceae bacterium]